MHDKAAKISKTVFSDLNAIDFDVSLGTKFHMLSIKLIEAT